MDNKVKELTCLSDKLLNWKLFDEKYINELMEKFEKIPREEYSTSFVPILTNECLIESLIQIGSDFFVNSSILINVVSSLGAIVWRYNREPSDCLFDFFKNLTKHKKANYYVSLYITSFPQFNYWSEKWNYLVSMPNIAPKKKSIVNFHTEIKKILRAKENIPSDVLDLLINTLKFHIKVSQLSAYSENEYSETIASLLEYGAQTTSSSALSTN